MDVKRQCCYSIYHIPITHLGKNRIRDFEEAICRRDVRDMPFTVGLYRKSSTLQCSSHGQQLTRRQRRLVHQGMGPAPHWHTRTVRATPASRRATTTDRRPFSLAMYSGVAPLVCQSTFHHHTAVPMRYQSRASGPNRKIVKQHKVRSPPPPHLKPQRILTPLSSVQHPPSPC